MRTVSIVIPAYRHEAYIADTLASIARQAFRGIEVIVVDDGSPDGTHEVASRVAADFPLPIKVLRQDNAGTCAAINHGLRHARGDGFAMIASDDLFAADRFGAQLAAFSARPRLEAVYANGRTFQGDAPGGRVPDAALGPRIHDAELVALLARPLPEIRRELVTRDRAMFIQAALFRRTAIDAVGGFDEATGVDDWPLNIRLFNRFTDPAQWAYVDADVVLYRQHAGQQYRDFFSWPQKKLRVIEAYCPPEWRDAAMARVCWLAGRELLYRSVRLDPAAAIGRWGRLMPSLLGKAVSARRRARADRRGGA